MLVMRYDQSYIEYARKKGIPDPEGNAARANTVLALIEEQRLDDALARLDGITDPSLRRNLETLLDVRMHWGCINP